MTYNSSKDARVEMTEKRIANLKKAVGHDFFTVCSTGDQKLFVLPETAEEIEKLGLIGLKRVDQSELSSHGKLLVAFQM